jgi:hypothetical protein
MATVTLLLLDLIGEEPNVKNTVADFSLIDRSWTASALCRVLPR